MRSGTASLGQQMTAFWRALGMVFALAFLAACETTDTTTTPAYFAEIRLAQVDVDFSRAERPLLVGDLDGQVSAQAAGGTGVGALGTRLGLVNQQARQAGLEAAVAQNVRPHIDDALRPLFTGTRPVRAVVSVRSVFVRSRLSLQQLTGTTVIVDGRQRPNNAQFSAGLTLYDLETGIPIQQIEPIMRVDDGAVAIVGGGPKAPDYGQSARLNQLIFDYAQATATALRQRSSGPGFTIPGGNTELQTLYETNTDIGF